jgi:hypothetical protein
MNLMRILNRGSSKLGINELTRELLWFCLRHNITPSEEWVSREANVFADDISKMLIPEIWMLSRIYFRFLDAQWGLHMVDLSVSNDNNQCLRFFFLHLYKGATGINAFA